MKTVSTHLLILLIITATSATKSNPKLVTISHTTFARTREKVLDWFSHPNSLHPSAVVNDTRLLFTHVGVTYCRRRRRRRKNNDDTLIGGGRIGPITSVSAHVTAVTLLLGDVTTQLLHLNRFRDGTKILYLHNALVSDCDGTANEIALSNYAALTKILPSSSTSSSSRGVEDTESFRNLLTHRWDERHVPELELIRTTLSPHAIDIRAPVWRHFDDMSRYNLSLLRHRAGDRDGAEQLLRDIVNEEPSLVPAVTTASPPPERDGDDDDDSSPPLVVLTVATETKREMYNLLSSAGSIRFSPLEYVPVEILGLYSHSSSSTGFTGTHDKIKLLRDKIASSVSEEQLVLFVDAYDTLLFPSVTELPTRWENGELTNGVFTKVVFGGEKTGGAGGGGYPDPALGHLYPPDDAASSIFPFLNSGTIIGCAGSILKMTEDVLTYPSPLGSDQRGYARYYLRNHRRDDHDTPADVGIDKSGRAFYSLYNVVESASLTSISAGDDDPATTTTTTVLEIGGRRPAVIHGNGGPRGGKEYYHNICKALLLPPEEDQHHAAAAGTTVVRVIPAPLFNFAGAAEAGEIDKETAVERFRRHVASKDGGGGQRRGTDDVMALVYLASELAGLPGRMEEAQEYLDLAVVADRAYVEQFFEAVAKETNEI